MNGPASRYLRQERLPQIGPEGQRRLRAGRVALVGLGALGCTAADLLARAGVGRLVLIDRDLVEWTNLQRQSLYSEADAAAARPKVEAAAARLAAVNGEVELVPLAVDLGPRNVAQALDGADVVVDGTDNFPTRYLINDWAVRARRPFVYAGAVASYGLTGAILPGAACLRCTWPEPPAAADTPTCRSAGVLGPVVAAIAALAAAEAIKILAGRADAVFPGYRYLDVWSGEMRSLRDRRDPECPCCGHGRYEWLDGGRAGPPAELVCGGGAVQLPPAGTAPDLEALERRLAGTVADLRRGAQTLRFGCEELEIVLFADGRVLVRGTEEPARARSIVARTLGA